MTIAANMKDEDLRMAQVDYFIATDRTIQAAEDAKREREKLLRLVQERSESGNSPAQNGGAA